MTAERYENREADRMRKCPAYGRVWLDPSTATPAERSEAICFCKAFDITIIMSDRYYTLPFPDRESPFAKSFADRKLNQR